MKHYSLNHQLSGSLLGLSPSSRHSCVILGLQRTGSAHVQEAAANHAVDNDSVCSLLNLATLGLNA